MPFSATDQVAQILQTLFVSFAELGKVLSTRHQLPQHGVQPNAVDTLPTKSGQQTVGERIQLRIGQRITKHGKIRINKPQLLVGIAISLVVVWAARD